jgi:two-component system sensor histidine kinase KdpD
VLASVLSIALFDFLFVPPYYTLRVEDIHYVLTFAVMLAVSLIMTHLTARIQEQATAARAGERRAAASYAMDRELRSVASRPAVLAIASRHIGQAVGGHATIVLVETPPEPGIAPEWPDEGVFESMAVRVAASWAYARGESAGNGTRRAITSEALLVPLKTAARTLGVVAVCPEPPGRYFSDDERRTVEALADQLAAELARPAWTA